LYHSWRKIDSTAIHDPKGTRGVIWGAGAVAPPRKKKKRKKKRKKGKKREKKENRKKGTMNYYI